MIINEKKIGDATYELEIEIPVKNIEIEYKAVFDKIKKSVKIDGFRKGKAPASIVEAKYQESADQDVLENLISSAFLQAIEEKKLTPIDRPKYDFDKISRDEPFKFKAIFETPPTIEIGKYKDIPATEKSCDITDADNELEITTLMERYAEVIPQDASHLIKNGDNVKLKMKNLSGESEDISESDYQDYNIIVGKSKDEYAVDKYTIGLKAGDEKEFSVKYPKKYSIKDVAGKEVNYKLLIEEINELKLPELDDEFAKKLNFENVADMREKSAANLDKYVGEKIRGEVKSDIINAIMEDSKFEIPQSIILKESDSIFKKTQERYGLKFETIDEFSAMTGIDAEMFTTKMNEEAQRSIKTTLILAEIIKVEEITVTEELFKAAIDRIALNANVSMDKIEEFLAQEGSRDKIGDEILFEQAMELIYNSAKIKKSKSISVEELFKQ